MAITDPSCVKFANEQIRTFCDRVPTFYALLKQHTMLFNDIPGLAKGFSNDASELVADGSPNDGRRAISGADVQALEAAIAGFVAQLEANDRALLKLVLKCAVNPQVTIG